MKITGKINLSIVIFIVLAILIFVFGIYLVFKDIKINSEKIIHQEQELKTLEIQLAGLQKFKAVSREIEETAERIDNLFIDSRVPVDFIRFLENLAEIHYLDASISPAASGKLNKDYWQSLVFQINSRGSFPDLLKFLEKLENGPYLMKIQNLNIIREEQGVRAAFSIKVFVR